MECIQDHYIHNFKFFKCSEFIEELFYEGISIYEVIRIESGVPLFLENHLNRLYESADIYNLNINESYCDFETLIEQLIKKNNVKSGKIKLVIQYTTEMDYEEKDFLIYFTSHYFPTESEITNGVKVGICKAIRNNPHAKILNSETRQKANNTIAEGKLFEVLLKDSNGYITEGSRSNVFFIKDDQVITPPKHSILMGITRTKIIKMCKLNNIKIIEKNVHIDELIDMDCAFISGTSLKILPIQKIEEINYNTQNKVLRSLVGLYNSYEEEYIKDKLS